jgi:hypothetical protein
VLITTRVRNSALYVRTVRRQRDMTNSPKRIGQFAKFVSRNKMVKKFVRAPLPPSSLSLSLIRE